MNPLARMAIIALCPAVMAMGPADDGRWPAGPYSYSDELGGFRIVAISGTGSKDDPVEIVQEFTSASSATLVIRTIRPINNLTDGDYATGLIHLRIVTINASGLPWVEFEFALQERLGEASTYWDGLSFDQRRHDGETLVSDSFARFERLFEPQDQIRFHDGVIDPGESGTFGMFITDFTPKWIFYLKQDPQVPFS